MCGATDIVIHLNVEDRYFDATGEATHISNNMDFLNENQRGHKLMH
jgi:hypothetical protein